MQSPGLAASSESRSGSRDRFEYIYLRPTNGRADDQILRNHTTQYAAHPEFDFERLFVHGAAQPCLIVNDVKFGDSEGAVALFVGPGSEDYFANLKIMQ